MDKAYLEICKRRQYVGARQSDILDWLAEYVDQRDADLKAKYEKAVAGLKQIDNTSDCKYALEIVDETLEELGEKNDPRT